MALNLLDIITAFDNLRPDSFDFNIKKEWVKDIETDIKKYMHLYNDSGCDISFPKEENPKMSLDDEYKELYIYYLISMADMANGEFKLYNVSSTYFNYLFDKFKKEYRQNNTPQKNTSIKY